MAFAFIAVTACGSRVDIAGGGLTSATSEPAASPTPKPAGTPPPTPPFDPANGTWREILPMPASVSPRGSSVWAGDQLVVWSNPKWPPGPGAAYRPADNEWRELAAPPKPIWGRGVWTGKEIVYWGGFETPSDKALNAGSAYSPATGKWRDVPAAPIPGKAGYEAVWTGKEMIVWGGMERCCAADSIIHDTGAAAYDPAKNTWRKLADVPAPWSGDDGYAIPMIDGDRMLVWRRGALGAYDISNDRWRLLETPVLPEEGCHSTIGPISFGALAGGSVVVWTGGCSARSGIAFDLAKQEWRRIIDAGGGSTSFPVAVGDAIFVAGSSYEEGIKFRSYSVTANRWTELPEAPSTVARRHPLLAWTGDELLAWGGSDGKDKDVRTGALYKPANPR